MEFAYDGGGLGKGGTVTRYLDGESHGNAFTRSVAWVQIDRDAAAEDADHLISAEERVRVAMARQ
jgi:arylsulfatase